MGRPGSKSRIVAATWRTVGPPRPATGQRLSVAAGVERAGDQFAAGFIYGLATGAPLEVAGRMGCVAAAEVIGHFGARPEVDVKALFRKAGLV